MKKISIFGCILLLVACNQSELDRLKGDKEKLEKQVAELNKQGEPLSAECQKELAIYQEALAKNSPDTEAKKASGQKICQQAFDVTNKALELQGEVFNVALAIVAEETKGEK